MMHSEGVSFLICLHMNDIVLRYTYTRAIMLLEGWHLWLNV